MFLYFGVFSSCVLVARDDLAAVEKKVSPGEFWAAIRSGFPSAATFWRGEGPV